MTVRIKIVVVGDRAIGKTCLLSKYTTGTIPSEYNPTVQDNFSKTAMFGDKEIALDIFEACSDDEYDKVRPSSYPGAQVVIICFSVVSNSSFERVTTKLCGEVKENCPGVPYILAALKTDLREDQEALSKIKEPPVDTEIGNTKATQIKAAKYIEVSTVNNINVSELFDEAIRLVIAPEKKKKEGSCCTIL